MGFISDLPTELVAAFRATLEEVLDADLILHVRDVSHPESAGQAKAVEDTLAGLGVGEGAELVEVWNKIDLLPPDARAAIEVQGDRVPAVFPVSAMSGDGLDALLAAVAARVDAPRHEAVLALSHDEGRARAWLFEQGVVQDEEGSEAGATLRVLWTDLQARRFRALRPVS